MADTEDHQEASDDEREGVMFAPSYHLEWLLGPDVEVVFTPEGWDE